MNPNSGHNNKIVDLLQVYTILLLICRRSSKHSRAQEDLFEVENDRAIVYRKDEIFSVRSFEAA